MEGLSGLLVFAGRCSPSPAVTGFQSSLIAPAQTYVPSDFTASAPPPTPSVILQQCSAQQVPGTHGWILQAAVEDVAALAASLKAAQASGQGSLASALAGLLVHMGQASAATQAALLDHFSSALDLAAMDAAAPSSSPHQVCRGHSFGGVPAVHHYLSSGFRDLGCR